MTKLIGSLLVVCWLFVFVNKGELMFEMCVEVLGVEIGWDDEWLDFQTNTSLSFHVYSSFAQ